MKNFLKIQNYRIRVSLRAFIVLVLILGYIFWGFGFLVERHLRFRRLANEHYAKTKNYKLVQSGLYIIYYDQHGKTVSTEEGEIDFRHQVLGEAYKRLSDHPWEKMPKNIKLWGGIDD